MKPFAPLLGVIAFAAVGTSHAIINVDLYGDDSKTAEKIVALYQKKLISLEENHLAQEKRYHRELPDALSKKYKHDRQSLCEQIKQSGGYIYADYDNVIYPPHLDSTITIEVITPKEKQRLKWLSESKPALLKTKQKHDLVQTMIDYQNEGLDVMMQTQFDINKVKCPGYHCTFGFNDRRLKPYQARFKAGVQKEKNNILLTLKSDSNIERRVAAAYLIGELNDPQAIISSLTPFVLDRNVSVRNAVIRVIGSTLYHSNIKNIDLRPFIQLIDSVHDEDRNKSLIVLYSVADDKKQKAILNQKAKPILLRLAKLKQPNNQLLAKLILEKIREK